MTHDEILRYAYIGALCEWNIEYSRCLAEPYNEDQDIRLANANAALDAIRELIEGVSYAQMVGYADISNGVCTVLSWC